MLPKQPTFTFVTLAWLAFIPSPPPDLSAEEPGPALPPSAPLAGPVSVAEARRQAKLLHAAMHVTLQQVHRRYYREDEGLPIPAAVVKDAFRDLAAEQSVKLRWLAVDGLAMNADHNPQDAFERQAVTALKGGQSAHEEISAGIYRRAGPIALTNHCLKCHVPDRKSTETRTAGLIISIPIRQE